VRRDRRRDTHADIHAVADCCARRRPGVEGMDPREGHTTSISSRADIEGLNQKMRSAEKAVRQGAAIVAADDADTESFVKAFRAGRAIDS
jgi:hypothetical protein